MGGVLHFFGEDVTGVDFSRNVSDFGITSGVDFADTGFAEIEVFDALAGHGMRPINRSLVVIVDGDGGGGIIHVVVNCAVFYTNGFSSTLISSYDLNFTGTKVNLVLANQILCNGASRVADDKTTEVLKLEQVK